MPRAGSSLSWNTTTSWEKTDGERAPGGEEPAPGGTAEEAATGAPPPAATGAAAASSHRRPLDTQSSVSSYGASFCYIRTEPDEEVELQTSERVPRNRARATIDAMMAEDQTTPSEQDSRSRSGRAGHRECLPKTTKASLGTTKSA